MFHNNNIRNISKLKVHCNQFACWLNSEGCILLEQKTIKTLTVHKKFIGCPSYPWITNSQIESEEKTPEPELYFILLGT